MRLVAMLDVIEAQATARVGHSAPPVVTRSALPSAPPLTAAEATEFDSLIAGLIPCRSGDPELWFAEQAPQIARAKALCDTCPIKAACLQGALDREEPWGVWGGEVFVDGQIVQQKRGRGRPRKDEAA